MICKTFGYKLSIGCRFIEPIDLKWEGVKPVTFLN
jgi:hypothetical protein